MFEEFSSGYYLGRLYVEPSDGEHAVMRRDDHRRINEQLYTTGEGVERLDNPLVMKVDRRHVAVHGGDGVPEGTLALPEGLLDDTRIRNPPTLKEVLLAKADRADQLLRYQETTPGVGT
ncbi:MULTISPECIES: DUF5802 family protein [Halorussus]|uniref:DUF5802 family protein n=1 Tax=Halorussus TaxID=1070314 RepID=UPI000E20E906|nr:MULTISPECIES: DUF5802 family protein [Halorussus]NHN59913.1 hypothetical protein [Halorussus sp. JP-T4]